MEKRTTRIKKWIRRNIYRIRHGVYPFCDLQCNEIYDAEFGCARFKTEIDKKDWEHGLYPESCKFY